MSAEYEYLLSNVIQSVLSEEAQNGPLAYFTRMLYGMEVGSSRFHPDISGYSLIFMMPPHLSGYESSSSTASTTESDSLFAETCRNIVFLGVDFTPPTTQVTTSQIPARNGAIPYGAEVGISGNMQLTFLDDADLSILGMHVKWLQYIEDVTRGIVNPMETYLVGDRFGQIDYATSAYIMKFKPTTNLTTSDIVYIGKCVGIFPIGIPDKESLGRRDSNELTMLPISYACAMYRQQVISATKIQESSRHDWIYDEFESTILSQYDSTFTTVGASTVVNNIVSTVTSAFA